MSAADPSPKPASPPSPPAPASPPAPEAPPTDSDRQTLTQAGFDPLSYYDDPDLYWRWAGQYMIQPWDPIRDASTSQRQAEADLLDLLEANSDGVNLHHGAHFTIFEAGCGRGRLAHFFMRNWPNTSYFAIDVGPLQTDETKRLVPRAEVFTSSIQAFDLDPLIAKRAWPESFDLVVSSEMLMHIKPDEIHDTLWKLQSMVAHDGHLLLIEWVPLPNTPRLPDAPHNFPHNYEDLFAHIGAKVIAAKRTGLQMIYLAIPAADTDDD